MAAPVEVPPLAAHVPGVYAVGLAVMLPSGESERISTHIEADDSTLTAAISSEHALSA
jgi:hypothetical protein